MAELGLQNAEAYRARLEADPAEWAVLDGFTRITISRFYRERDAFAYLCETTLPALHRLASGKPVQIWSAGCAGGEEAYTLAIAAREQGIPVRIVGTDSDVNQLERARRASYSSGCLKDLPPRWRASWFDQREEAFVLRNGLRGSVELLHQDIRKEMPDGPFHLLLCRYLAFTYFDAPLQLEMAERLLMRTVSGGFIALGKHESWPTDAADLVEVRPGLRIYRV
jgi:chemotaxis protein methyltransferase CheR